MTARPPTFHVQLFPTFPPTSNAPEPVQRSHRRFRSSPKLDSLFQDLDSEVDVMPKVPTLTSPGTRAVRRSGQVLHSQSSSTSPIESDYVFVDNHYPSFRSHIKPVTGKSGNTKAGVGVKLNNTGKGREVIAQPCRVQLRTLPVPPPYTSIKPEIPPLDQLKPLSPVYSSFKMDTPATTSQRSHHSLTDNEKRKKLEKLSRTLGENIPPELVFRSPPAAHQRTTSMSVSGTRKSPSSHKPSQSNGSSLPVVEITPAPQLQPERKPEKQPRSKSLTTSPTIARRGTISAPAYPTIDPRPFQGTIRADADTQTRKPHDALSIEWGRRKEREWSGEWNVKDMDHVVKALRGLKAR